MRKNHEDYAWYPAPRYLLRKKLVLRCLDAIGCKGKSILEIGFGSGDFLCSFHERGMKAFGYDFSEGANKEVMRQLAAHGISPEKICIYDNVDDAYAGKYDVLAAFEVLEHMEDDLEILKKWNGSINERGYLLISVPSRMKKWCANDEWAGHYRRYEKQDIIEKMGRSGFKVIRLWSYPFPVNLILDVLLNIGKKQEAQEHKRKQYSKADATKESGVKKRGNKIERFLSKEWFIMPWHFLQILFLNTDLGSGYVILARKVRNCDT